MSRFTDRLDAITYAEHLLESAALPDHTIAVVTDVLRQRTLEYLNIDVADPPSRAIERLKKILGEAQVTNVSLQQLFPFPGSQNS